MKNINRVFTGIEGLDELIGGGIPEKSNVLVFGKPGSGKTNFGLEYIYRGVEKFNEPGVFVSFEQTEDFLKQQSHLFGWNLEKYLDKKMVIKNFKITEVGRDFANEIISEVKRIKAKRLVIDTLSLISLAPLFYGDEKYTLIHSGKVYVAYDIQQFIYNLIHIINSAGITTMYITMSDRKEIKTTDGISEYLCDGIIYLGFRSLGQASLRTLEVIKMRRSEIPGGIYNFKITNFGIKVNGDE